MKRLLFILTALMVITATGCKKDPKPIDCKATLPGEWHCMPEGIDAEDLKETEVLPEELLHGVSDEHTETGFLGYYFGYSGWSASGIYQYPL